MIKQRQSASQAGFTLVELAIVMIIIGLLIAGVLKGQALIQNAQVTSTVSQIKSIEAAGTTFKDTYSAIPGDLVNPATRLPNCVGACIVGAGAANGDGILANTPAVTPIGTEGEAFFPQLNVASLFTGITGGPAASLAVGVNFPQTKIANNVLMAGSSTGVIGNFAGNIINPANVPERGLYLTIANAIGASGGATMGLKPDQAGRIDSKVDDGVPDTGLVRAYGATGNTTGANNCGTITAPAASGAYATDTTLPACGLHIHIQN